MEFKTVIKERYSCKKFAATPVELDQLLRPGENG